jgi:hypothetical protein
VKPLEVHVAQTPRLDDGQGLADQGSIRPAQKLLGRLVDVDDVVGCIGGHDPVPEAVQRLSVVQLGHGPPSNSLSLSIYIG